MGTSVSPWSQALEIANDPNDLVAGFSSWAWAYTRPPVS